MSSDCNKYIIKNNDFIRDFDTMYQKCSDPWGQEQTANVDLLTNTSLFLLNKIIIEKNICVKNVLDVGCGPGHLSLNLLKNVGDKLVSYCGTDISSVAIAKAKKRYLLYDSVNVMFEVDNIILRNPSYVGKYDLIFCGKTIYYVALEIDIVMKNLKNYLRKGGLFVCSYNQKHDSYSNQYLGYTKLYDILLENNFQEILTAELNRFQEEIQVVFIFKKA